MNSPERRRREILYAALLLAAAILLFWWRIWIPSPTDRLHFSDDVLVKDYPTRIGLYRILLSGHLPLWDPYQFGGWPGIANCEAGFFYPFNFVLLPFVYSPETAFTVTEWLILFHFFIAGLGAFRLARHAGITFEGAVLAAVAFTFCGFHCAHSKHTNMLFAFAWFPWIFLQLEHWLAERTSLSLLRACLLLGLSFTAGHPQASLYMSLVLLSRAMFAAFTHHPRPAESAGKEAAQMLLPILAIILLAFALTAIQWLPTRELILQSARAEANQYQQSSMFSLPPYELIEAALPEVFRPWSQIEVFYWGIPPLLLTLIMIFTGVAASLLQFMLWLALAAVLLSLGEHFFLYDLTYLLVPGTAWVRAPSRWIYFASLPIALSSGYALDSLRETTAGALHRLANGSWKYVLWALLATGVIVLLIAILGDTFFHLFITVVLGVVGTTHPASTERLAGEFQSSFLEMFGFVLNLLLLGLFFTMATVAALYFFLQQKMSPRLFAALLILLTWLDLATHYHTLGLEPGPGGFTLNDEVERLQTDYSNHRTKIFLHAGGYQTLYHGAAQNFRELDGQSPLTPALNLQLRIDTAPVFPDKPNLALLKLCGVNAILTDSFGLPETLTQITDSLYSLNTPSVRARLLPEALPVQADDQRDLLTMQSFPFHRVALVEPDAYSAMQIATAMVARPLFPKPFLLASASANAVQAGAHFVVDGVDHFNRLKESAGYFVAVADSNTGEVEKTAAFNLMLDADSESPLSSRRLHAFIASIPDGKTVAVAVKDSAANVLGADGMNALRWIGASLDLRKEGYRYAHAILGKKGAPPGSALEIFSPTETLVLQTDQSVYLEGVRADQPTFQLYAGTDHAADWFELLHNRIPQFAANPTARATTTLTEQHFPFPLLLFSSPNKTYKTTKDQAVLWVNGEDLSFNRLGYNVAVLDPTHYTVVHRDAFNLLADYDVANPTNRYVKSPPVENERMQAFIRSVTNGFIVVGAVRDEAIDLMQRDTFSALRELGSRLEVNLDDPAARKHTSHAFLLIKGSTFGVEIFGHEQDAIIYTRYPGGPRLISNDIRYGPPLVEEIHPIAEVTREASAPAWIHPSEAGAAWTVEEDGPGRLLLSGQVKAQGWLFLSEVFHPGWRAYVDGLETPIRRVDYYFRALPLSPGEHAVEMKYAPDSFKTGAWITLFTILGLLAWRIRLLFPANPSSQTNSVDFRSP